MKLNTPLFGYKYIDADGNQGEGVLRVIDFVKICCYMACRFKSAAPTIFFERS